MCEKEQREGLNKTVFNTYFEHEYAAPIIMYRFKSDATGCHPAIFSVVFFNLHCFCSNFYVHKSLARAPDPLRAWFFSLHVYCCRCCFPCTLCSALNPLMCCVLVRPVLYAADKYARWIMDIPCVIMCSFCLIMFFGVRTSKWICVYRTSFEMRQPQDFACAFLRDKNSPFLAQLFGGWKCQQSTKKNNFLHKETS